MVAWVADGTMAGYDPVTKRLKKGLYHFASPGTVDLKGTTRFNQPIGAGLSTTTYPNNPQLTAAFSFSAADFAANGNKISPCVIIVDSAQFPAGKVPTPSEIYNLPESRIAYARAASTYVFGPGSLAAWGFDWVIENQEWRANTKWWILIYPAKIVNTSKNWSKANNPMMAGANINTIGRALSFYSNRTPAKPTITSPIDGAIVSAGAEFTLRLNPADPDEVTPEDAAKYNDDVNGVHFECRPAPTSIDPDPPWQPLMFDWAVPGSDFSAREAMWYIRGSRFWNGVQGDPDHEALVANLGAKVLAGKLDSKHTPGKGRLDTGDWQIRGRTFDYGHPYPNSGTKTTEPGPLGINHNTNWLIEPAIDTYPTDNTSPWSDPVTVRIPSQVPPPIPVSPIEDGAVSGNPVRLSWKYRNTHVPPRDQYGRAVQIRKVNDPLWSTVFDGLSSDPYVDLPTNLVQTPIPPVDLLPDGDSEAGTAGTWHQYSTMFWTTAYTNINNSAKSHGGNRYVELRNPPGLARPNEFIDDFYAEVDKVYDIPPEYTTFDFDGWIWLDTEADAWWFTYSAVWLDADGAPIYGPPDQELSTPFTVNFISRKFSGTNQWRRISDLVPDYLGEDQTNGTQFYLGADVGSLRIKRPANGVALYWGFNAYVQHDDPDSLPDIRQEMRIDDFTVIGTAPETDNFSLLVPNQYEWRVSATDTDGVESAYGTPARFWMVPAGGSGAIVPAPGETIEGATLGCGTHRVEVYRRGGKVRVGELMGLSHVDWSRVRDDISTAQVVVSGWDEDCGNLLASLQTWAYELVIFRDNGFSVDRVWEGPITLLTYERDKVTIDAKDVMGYAYRRIIKQKMTDSGTGNGTTVVDRARRIIQNVFAPDDPNVLGYLQILPRDDDAMQYRSTPAWSRTAYEEVDDMAANSGLDYTAVGRAILLWGTKHRIGTLPELRDEDLGASPIVSEYGMQMANVYSVSDGNGVHGEATRGLDPVSGNDDDYGLVEVLSSTWASDSEGDTGTYTQAGLETVKKSFQDFAERSISDKYPPPVVVRVPDNTSLNPDTVISIQHLVPGVVIPLRSNGTLRTVEATQKLDSVKVVEDAGKETVTITLSPFSRDDAGTAEGAGEE